MQQLPKQAAKQLLSVGTKAARVARPTTTATTRIPYYAQGLPGTRNVHSETQGKETGKVGQETPYQREHEHDPDVSEPASFSEEFEHRIPSNKARPTLSDEYQHSGIDERHPKRPAKEDLPPKTQQKVAEQEEHVKQHNEEVEQRYDRAFSQINQEGEVETLGSEMEDGHPKGE